MKKGAKGFGVIYCSHCGRQIQSDPTYYQLTQRTEHSAVEKELGKRNRKLKLLKTLCESCYVRDQL